MHTAKTVSLAASAALLLLARAPDARACGGCLGPPVVQQSEATVVTGHRMVLSVSKDRTTLWDQITYSGQPASFAWVLPIRGKVDIGLSSDALFQNLERLTQVTVRSPVIQCPVGPGCSSSRSNSGLASATTENSSDPQGQSEPPVEVIAEEVVGPYETVQLSSTDAGALAHWLDDHGYEIPADIAPVIGAYVSDGFDSSRDEARPRAGRAGDAAGARHVAGRRRALAAPHGRRRHRRGHSDHPLGGGRGATSPPTCLRSPSMEARILWNWDTSSSNYAAPRAMAISPRPAGC
ncbi:MAG: DUF2330 domain-containing protein [Byssovorax sp.]